MLAATIGGVSDIPSCRIWGESRMSAVGQENGKAAIGAVKNQDNYGQDCAVIRLGLSDLKAS